MKNRILVLCLFTILSSLLRAQAPDRFSFQAVVRNSAGNVVAGKNVGVRIQLLLGSQFGAAMYVETQQALTNANGLFSIEIGGGTVVTGDISQIDWSWGAYYLKAEIDPEGGDNYTITTISQILSVPYAKRAAIADSVTKTATLDKAYHAVPLEQEHVIAADAGVLHIAGEDGFLVTGSPDNGVPVAASSNSAEMFFNPNKAAFRSGFVAATGYWNNDNIGKYSVAMGYNTEATGQSAVALGESTAATSVGTTALGFFSTAQNNYATAIGFNTDASGAYSVAMGYDAVASGLYSTALGPNSNASGQYGTALGNHVTASGGASTAMGSYVNTNNHQGAFIIGDNSSSTVTNSTADHQMMARFAGGYMFYTNYQATIGARLLAGANSWSTISDSSKKENLLPVDEAAFLSKINKMHLSSWNYKGQDATQFRHYGPMAQEFYAAFGKDKIGVIGNDTTINQADMEGVCLIAIQGLIKENETLKKQLIKLQADNNRLQSVITFHDNEEEIKVRNLEAKFSELYKEINVLEIAAASAQKEQPAVAEK